MANQVIRITLKAYDHQLIDQSAKKIIETAIGISRLTNVSFLHLADDIRYSDLSPDSSPDLPALTFAPRKTYPYG